MKAERKWSWSTVFRLREGRPIEAGEWPDPPPLFTYEDAVMFPDLATDLTYMYVISSRLRSFLEAEAPGAAEYLPVRFEGPRSEEIPEPYWAMNWLRVLDCMDEDACTNIDEDGKPFIVVPVIDPAKAPEDGVLGLLGGYTVMKLIRNDLRLKMQKAGFTGIWFMRLSHSRDPFSPQYRLVGRPDKDPPPPPPPPPPKRSASAPRPAKPSKPARTHTRRTGRGKK
ncbi:MAG: hypothetical protein H6811_01580 [Phycisphaeraceae bacterium]|nr:hypothetical protein [Phycisphaeraceae bacterium]